LVTKAIDKIRTGEGIQQQDLVISKSLRHDIEKYRSLFAHVSAAIQLLSNNAGGNVHRKAIPFSISIQTQNTTILCAELYL
jgi:DNA polymerase elongation subunit (family B)